MKSILFRLRGTVILKSWWKILLVTVNTTVVICIVKFALDLEFNTDSTENGKEPTSTIVIFGLFTGFLLVFRTNTAYDRYWEGRKFWSSVITNIRILTRLIWTLVSFDKLGSTNKLIIEQVSTKNLLTAFAYATRNFLRGNNSYDESDLQSFIKHVPQFQEQIQEDKISRTLNIKISDSRNIPIEISHLIMSYIKCVRKRGLVDDPTTTTMNNALNSLVDCIAQFEKILRTPIPLAYSVHLNHVVWLYFLALPYQLIGLLDWWTIPVVTLAAFIMLGILDIGWEIENPFGYDENDLPMDEFCNVIHHEILDIVGNPLPPADTWIVSKANYPLMPESNVPAMDLVKLTEEDIRDILLRYGTPNGKIFK